MQRGRKSLAALAVARSSPRLGPPAELGEIEREIWLSTVNSLPAEWFGAEHRPLLVNYVRHVVNADVIDQQIKAFDPAWLKTDAGLARYERLLTMFRHETTALQHLARSMRLTHQAKYRADKAAPLADRVKGERPWEDESPEATETSGGLRNTA